MNQEDEYKFCKQCEEVKLTTRFSPQKTYSDGRESVCRDCRNRSRKKYNKHAAEQYRKENYPRGKKPCTRCGALLKFDRFCKQTKYPDGLNQYCRRCAKDMNVPFLPEYTKKKLEKELAIQRGEIEEVQEEKPKKKRKIFFGF